MHNVGTRIITGLLLGLATFFSLFYLSIPMFLVLLGCITFYVLAFEWSFFCKKVPLLILLTPIYPLLPIFLFGFLQLGGYNFLNFFLISLVAAHDTGSYFMGKYAGSHKIAPTISPGKTWEGLLGGIGFTQALSILFFKANHLLLSFFFALSVSLLAFFGDLFESYLKRQVQLKDSGSLLPGHGGLLDRIDSLLFVIPLVYCLRHLLYAAL